MTIAFEILGQRNRDNALLVKVDSGQKQHSLLFDCGDGCLADLGLGMIQGIDALFFSHLHMDHIGGFDSYFRCNFNRNTKPNLVCGPLHTGEILQHRFQGFIWNLIDGKSASWVVEDIEQETIKSARFELSEAFSVRHDTGIRVFDGKVMETPEFTVEAFVMDHGIDSIAYMVREASRVNIDMSEVAARGLKPGSWIKTLKSTEQSEGVIEIDGKQMELSVLRQDLLTETSGDSIAYLTDFYLTDAEITHLAPSLRGCKTMVCEAQYRHADLELAKKNRHMTVANTATLARAAEVESLVLFHISERYDLGEQQDMLAEAQAIFPNTTFPAHWA